jgi:hypothetical protein
MPQMLVRALALSGLAVLMLAACSEDKTGSCPTMTALVPASEASVFKPNTPPDPSNLLYTIAVTKVKGDCDMDKKFTHADVTLDVKFHATRAPSATAENYRFPYFVAVTEGTDRVLAKKTFWVPFAFASGQSSVDFSDSVSNVTVNSVGDKRTYDYQVIVGLQLTKSQYDFNRTQQPQ